jgi:DNA-binding transcriptional LysR family regulator
MFTKLFAESGLSLDRLKALLAVAASGSIVKASVGDPVRQSQYSRQIKELEQFFQIKLVERHGKGVRLTANGRELARISRFFLLGLSNFQRGCLSEEQTFRIGAGATYVDRFLLPLLSSTKVIQGRTRYVIEIVREDDIERRLHDLTLDFGVTIREAISRPLQLGKLSKWKLSMWVPLKLHQNEKSATLAFKRRELPLVVAKTELDEVSSEIFADHDRRLICENFLQALKALKGQQVAAILPDYLIPDAASKSFLRMPIPGVSGLPLLFRLAWNPRLLRLNPHATRRKDFLIAALSAEQH